MPMTRKGAVVTGISRRELTAWLIGLALAITAITALNDRAQAGTNGLAGPHTRVVYIATGANFPDALGAAATAAVGLGPVLLVQQNAIPAATLSELNRLQPPEIVIVGGTGVVSASVEAQLKALSFSPTVTRQAGSNRFETAAALSASHFPTTGLYPRLAYTSSDVEGVADEKVESTILSVVIEAPDAGYLQVSGGAGFTTDVASHCSIQVNGSEVSGSLRSQEHSTSGPHTCETSGAVAVGPGSHTVTLHYLPAEDGSFSDRSLSALWVPFNGFGMAP